MPSDQDFTDIGEIDAQIATIESQIKKFKRDFPDRKVPEFFNRQLMHLEGLRVLHKKA